MQLFLHCFTWYPGSQWVVRLGIFFATVAVVLTLIPGQAELAWIWLKMAYVILAFHFLSLPGYLRNLLSNHRLGLIPRFYRKTGIAMFLFTLFGSVFLQATTLLLGLDTLAPGTALFFFTMASVYMGYVQFAVTRKHSLVYMAVFVLSFSLMLATFLRPAGTDWIIKLLPFFTATAFICAGGWCWAIDFISRHDNYKPARSIFSLNMNFMESADKEGFKGMWDNRDRDLGGTTYSGTLLIGMPDGRWNYFKGAVMWLMVFPTAMVTIILLFSFFTPSDTFPPVFWAFLVSSAFLGGWSTLGFGEFTARSRFLWLRLGAYRKTLWDHLERIAFDYILMFFACALIVAMVYGLVIRFEATILVNYL